jgi:transglutaminase-like putative cysteine protease
MRTLRISLLLLAPAFGPAYAADDVPAWIKEAAAFAVPGYPAKVTSVVLFREETVTVEADGKRVMHERGAIKVLQPNGDRIEAYRTYNNKNGRIRDFQGWLVPPTGRPVPYAKNRIVDVALSKNYVYDEARAKVLECGIAPPGSIFAWEVTEEEKSIFTQDSFEFQARSPVLVSRFVLTLPPAWELKGMVFNRENVEPKVSGSTYSWELRNLPWIEREDYSPSISSLAPRLAVSYFPPSVNASGLQGLKDWAAVSTWLTPFVDPPAEVTDTVRAKAIQLTAGASGELERIRSIARFVQQTNYVEVALNITRGGGYTPHRSQDVLERNYGDCKDKATLMRALLKAVGLDAYLTTIDAEDRTFVQPGWASPMQFNHAIVAIRVSESVSSPSVVQTTLGRLLMFDPTDPLTPVGDLPKGEQGSHALVIAGAKGMLLSMPVLPALSNRTESVVEASLDLNGDIDARIQRRYFGQSGIFVRAIDKFQGASELKKLFERSFSRALPTASLARMVTEPGADENHFAVNIDLAAQRFGQIMQGRLFVVRPGLLTSGTDYVFRAKERTAPIKTESDLMHDLVKIKIPPGFKLDELPEPEEIKSPYGTLRASWSVEDGVIVMEDTLEIFETLAPAAEYAKVREFFELVQGAHSAPVVFLKQ